MRAVHAARRFGRSVSRDSSRPRSWVAPAVTAGGFAAAAAAAVAGGHSLADFKDDIAIRGEALVRGLRTLKAAVIITADYKLNLPNKPHDSEEYTSAMSACNRYVSGVERFP